MESVLGRHRNLIILLGVIFLQALGLAVQVKRSASEGENPRLIRIWAVGAVTPLERVLVWVSNSTGNIWHNYFYLRGVRAENRELKEQIEQMRLEQVRLTEDAAQAHRLQALLAFKEQFIAKTVAAQVIGTSGSDASRIVYIDRGDDYHLGRDMAVTTADGIVGKVVEVFPSVAKVLLINDQSSGVGVILEKSRLQGVLRGTANGEVMLDHVMSDEQVPVGETVLTSGGDQIFPKGLPVGTVTKVGSGKDLFLNIKIKPAADLSKLEEVLVLVEKQQRQATAEDGVHMRAADILAQRLPSVPEKPAPDAPAKSAPEGSTKPVVTSTAPKAAASGSVSPGVKNPPAANSDRAASPQGQLGKPAGQSPGAHKPSTAPATAAEESKPDASQSTPAPSQPEVTKPPSAPPNSQPPADNTSPN